MQLQALVGVGKHNHYHVDTYLPSKNLHTWFLDPGDKDRLVPLDLDLGLPFLSSAFAFVDLFMLVSAILSSGTFASLEVVANASAFARRRGSGGRWRGVSFT